MALQNVLGAFSDELEKSAEAIKKQVVQGTVQSIKKQVTGKEGSPDKNSSQTQSLNSSNDTGSEYFKQMMKGLTKLDPQQLQAKKQQDANVAAQVKAQIRQHLNRYQEQENALKAYRAKKAQELRADVAGKPGQGKNMEEQAEKMEDMQKKQKEEEKKKKGLPDSIEQLKGTKEIGKFAVG